VSHPNKVDQPVDNTKENVATAIDFKKFLNDKLKDVKAAQSHKYRLVPVDEADSASPTYKMNKEGKYKGCTLDDYMNIKVIGKGAYAEVKEGINEGTKEKVALKFYKKSLLKDTMKKSNVIREIRILEKLDHPNIMRIFDCMEDSKNVIIVLEYIAGISLNEYLAKIPDHKLNETEVYNIFKQLLSAVAYCHSKGITHRDLKLENILLTPKGEIKLVDFGFSTFVKTKQTTFCGTPTYMAPEIIIKKEYEGPPTDMWALGIILFVLLCGYFPFQAARSQELYKRIEKGLFSIPTHIGKQFQRILSKLICVNPGKRNTAAETLNEL